MLRWTLQKARVACCAASQLSSRRSRVGISDKLRPHAEEQWTSALADFHCVSKHGHKHGIAPTRAERVELAPMLRDAPSVGKCRLMALLSMRSEIRSPRTVCIPWSPFARGRQKGQASTDRKSTRLNSSH